MELISLQWLWSATFLGQILMDHHVKLRLEDETFSSQWILKKYRGNIEGGRDCRLCALFPSLPCFRSLSEKTCGRSLLLLSLSISIVSSLPRREAEAAGELIQVASLHWQQNIEILKLTVNLQQLFTVDIGEIMTHNIKYIHMGTLRYKRREDWQSDSKGQRPLCMAIKHWSRRLSVCLSVTRIEEDIGAARSGILDPTYVYSSH